jgi:poly(A) polymerase
MLLKLIQQVIDYCQPKKKPAAPMAIVKIPYEIDRSLFSPCAIKVIERLQHNGYQAYFVGGCLRDILLGHRPKDFDIVTNAKPDEITQVFSNALIIGRRFTLVHVRFRNELIEVATFRRAQKKDVHATTNGIVFDDNTYGTLEDDVIRRDFTVNALYYDPMSKVMIDHVGGLYDAKHKQLKTIGDDQIRFTEDPVRMIRAIRYAAKLGLKLTTEIKDSIVLKAPLILHVPKARLYEEFTKSFSQPNATAILSMMVSLKLARYLIPKTLLVAPKQKKISGLLQWVNQQQPYKEHQALLIILCFIAPSLQGLTDKKLGDTLAHLIREFQKMILVPKQIEYALKNLILNEKPPEDTRMRIKPMPEMRRLKGMVVDLLAKCR